MLPHGDHMRNAQGGAILRNLCRLLGTFGPQVVVHRHRLDRQPSRPAQMQKGGGIPTARKRHSDHLSRWQPGPDQPDQPVGYGHANPCIATAACVCAMLPG